MEPIADPSLAFPSLPEVGDGPMTEADFEAQMVEIIGFGLFYDIVVDLMQDNE